LLLKLALAADRWSVDWTDATVVRDFRIADLACGTGTLLMAASQAITDNFVRSSVKQRKPVDASALRQLHQAIMEDILHGYDVLPSAVHLTASTLALLAPEIAFRKMQLYSLPLGKLGDSSIYLGSIEYLHSDRVSTQLDLMGDGPSEGAAGALSGRGTLSSVAPLPPLDLCVMNPPFVRSVNSNLLFGSLPQHRAEMQRELSRRLHNSRGREVLASTTAGLASIFTAIGDRHLKPGGRLALVLPAAVTAGGSWSRTRRLIDTNYALEQVVASHDATRWAFSENTDLSEVLLVARKRRPDERPAPETCTFINLWRNPTATADALAIGESISNTSPAQIGSLTGREHGIAAINVGTTKWGEALQFPLSELQAEPWLGCAFAQTDLVRVNWHLRRGRLLLPGSATAATVNVCALEEVAELGPDGRDIHDGFTHGPRTTAYPALWNHDADAITTMNIEPNRYLTPRARPAAGRPERPASLLWPHAARPMLAVRLWFKTIRLVAVRLTSQALSNVWYPLKLRVPSEPAEKALVLWLNSTLGVLLLAGHRVPTRGPWVQFKKPTWNPMPVLNISTLGARELAMLADAYDRLLADPLLSLPYMESDPTRRLIDDTISRILRLPPLHLLREMLSREPIITNAAIGMPSEPTPTVSEQFELLR
jgi:hypothetical protein